MTAVKDADAEALKKVVAVQPSLATAPETAWALGSVVDRGCREAALVLLDAGAAPVVKREARDGDPQQPLALAILRNMDDVFSAMLPNIEPYSARNETSGYLGDKCDLTPEEMGVLRGKGYTMASERDADELASLWVGWHTCSDPTSLRVALESPQAEKPPELLLAVVDWYCPTNPSEFPRRAQDIKQQVEFVKYLLDHGYSLEESVEYFNGLEQLNTSPEKVLNERACYAGFAKGIQGG